jgi:hypothetical protein
MIPIAVLPVFEHDGFNRRPIRRLFKPHLLAIVGDKNRNHNQASLRGGVKGRRIHFDGPHAAPEELRARFNSSRTEKKHGK